MEIKFKDRAGLVELSTEKWSFHFLVRPSEWLWGYRDYCEDNLWCFREFGLGPLFLFVWD